MASETKVTRVGRRQEVNVVPNLSSVVLLALLQRISNRKAFSHAQRH